MIQPDLVLKEQTQRNVPCALQNGAPRRKGPAARTEHSAAPTSSAALRVGTSFASLRWGATRLGDGDGPAGARNLRHAEEQRGRSAKQRGSHNGTDPRPGPREKTAFRSRAALLSDRPAAAGRAPQLESSRTAEAERLQGLLRFFPFIGIIQTGFNSSGVLLTPFKIWISESLFGEEERYSPILPNCRAKRILSVYISMNDIFVFPNSHNCCICVFAEFCS